MTDLVDGRLEGFGVHESIPSFTLPPNLNLKDACYDSCTVDLTECGLRCLTDGHDYVWVGGNESGFVNMITCYAFNNPTKILQAIAEAFDTDIFSEHEPQFWGFHTQGEWDAAWGVPTKEQQDEFYLELLKFACNKPNRITPGTKGEIDAKIAKQLVEADPTLIQPGRREDLFKKINEVFIRDHVPKSSSVLDFSAEAIAELKRMFAHQKAFCQKGIRRY